jgi:SulP family sulfate permease
MINLPHFFGLLVHAPKSDALVLVLTFALTLFCGIVMAVNVGVMLSALILMHRMAGSSHIDRLKRRKYADYDFSQMSESIAIYSITGPIFFGMMDKFSNAFSSVERGDKIIILRMCEVPFIDTTGLENLKLIITACKKRGIAVLLSETNEAVMRKLRRSRMFDSLILKSAEKSIIEVIDIASSMLSS